MTIKINGDNTVANPGFSGDDTDTGLQVGTNELKLVTGGTARATVDSSGNVGIGTANPAVPLHIYGTNGLYVQDSTNNKLLDVRSKNNIAELNAYDGDDNSAVPIVFKHYTSERLRIDSSGRVLIGTTSSNDIFQESQLQIEGNTSATASLSLHQNQTAVDGPQLILGKSRGSGSVGSSDILGDIVFAGNDGTDVNSRGAIIRARIDGTPGSNDLPTRLAFFTTADGASSPTERMRIDSSGDVEVKEGANLTWVSSFGSTHRARIRAGSNTSIKFENGSSNTERMQLDSSGNLLVGKSSSNFANQGVEIRQAGEITLTRQGDLITTRRLNTEGVHISIRNNSGSTIGSVSTNGTNTSFNTSSDYRLKENVVDIVDGITRVKQLQPKRFNFIANADTTVDGFLAHEAQTVVPEAVIGTYNEVDENGDPVMQGIDQSKLVPLLTAALQEAIAKIETLETKVAALEAA